MHALLPWLRRHRIALSVTAGLLLTYTLVGFFLVPHLARSAIHDYVENTLGRHVEIGELTFNPYSFVVHVSDFHLREANDEPLLGFGSLLVNAEPFSSLFHRAITLKQLQLLAPDINAIIAEDGSINLAKLAPPPSDDAPPPPKEPTSVPRIRITDLEVSDGRVAFEDRSREQPFSTALEPIHFALHDFSTIADHQNPYRFEAATIAGERFTWSGAFSVQPLGSEGDFGVHGLRAATIDAYLQGQLPAQLSSGVIDLDGHYKLALQPELELGVTLPAITLRDFAVAKRGSNEEKAPIAIRQIGVDTLAFSLSRRELTVKAVDIDGAQLDVRRERDGSINLLTLLAGDTPPPAPAPEKAPKKAEAPAAATTAAADPAKPDEAAAATEPAEAAQDATPPAPMRIAVERVHLGDASVHIEDRAVKPAAQFALAPIDITIDGYSSDPEATLNLAADVTINDSGHLHAQGTTRLQPLQTQIALQLDGFSLAAVQPYVAQASNATLNRGVLAVKGDFGYTQPDQGAAQLRFRGDVNVADFRASGGGEGKNRRDDFARWGQLAISGIDFQQTPDKLSVERVTLKQPYARVVINPDQTLNVAQILKPSSPAASTPAPAKKSASAPMPIRIGQISLTDGSAFFADRSIEPSFATGIVKLHGAIRNLSSDPKSRATIKLDGQVDKYSPVEINGNSSLLAATEHTDIKLAFRNMELTTFNPYSGKFAGYDISKGKLTTELSYKIEQRQLEAEHHVIVDQLEFGDATHSKDAAPLPIKLAVALLKDRRGIIDLELPVRGSLDDPEFRYGKIVWSVLGNIVTKIVTAPFAAIGSMFGGGDELSYIDFPAGSAELTPAATGKLDTLGKALADRPQLKLDVPVTVSDTDRDALARAALAAKLPADTQADKAHLRALEKLHKELLKASVKFPDGMDDIPARIAYVEPLVLAKLAPNEDQMQRIARARAHAVQAALLAKPDITGERVFITTDQTPEAGDDGMVRMKLKLQ